jgi:hypothetical protein
MFNIVIQSFLIVSLFASMILTLFVLKEGTSTQQAAFHLFSSHESFMKVDLPISTGDRSR